MRKKDYEHLAAVIKRKQENLGAQITRATDKETVTVASSMRLAVRDIAESFAEGACVDKRAFLTACGFFS